MYHFKNFSFLFKYLVIFLAFIIMFSVAGSIFGTFAGGSFSATMDNFGSSISSVDRALLKPVRDFAKFFGIVSPGLGGSSIVYERLPDDPVYSPLIPDNAAFGSVVLIMNTMDLGVFEPLFVIVFYDDAGSPITGYLVYHNRVRFSGYYMGTTLYNSLDVSRCFYNKLSKYEYVDIDIHYTLLTLEKVFNYKQDSALLDYTYSGNFYDIQGWLIE